MEFVKDIAVWVVAFLVADGIVYVMHRRRK